MQRSLHASSGSLEWVIAAYALSCSVSVEDPPASRGRSEDVMVGLQLAGPGGVELSFFSTITTFGTPLDITVSELGIEAFFPADEVTAEALRSVAASA
jgi:hypothetical protein